jgi:lambda family phage tail tape measure protein
MANEVIKIVFKVDDKEITVAEKKVAELADAVDDVESSSKKGGVSLKGLGGAAGAVAAAAAAAGAAVVAFGKQTLDTAREIDNLSRIAGLSAEEFQRQAHAARSVGIEQDKYADIIKDTNDKIGDFLVTGAGPMADFFDSVGKKVGVTAEQFKGLSGDQALGLYVDTLEKAGVNQQEAAFFMEALASDATALYPLLVDNARGMNEMGDAAGAVLSEEQIRNARELNQQFDNMASNIKNQLMGAFIDVATEAGKFFNLLGTEAEKAAEREIRRLDDEIENVADSLNKLRTGELDSISESFADLNDIAVEDNWLRDDEIADQERLVRIMEDKLKALKQAQLAAFDQKAVATEEADEQERATNAWRERTQGSGVSVPGAGGADDELSEITVTATRRTGATGIEKQMEIQREYEEWLAKRNADKAQELEDIKIKWGAITDVAVIHKEDIAELDMLLEMGAINQEHYNEKIAELNEQENPFAGLTEELTNFDSLMKQSAADGIMQMSDALAEMVVSGKADFKSLAASILQDIAKMIIKMLILKAIQASLGGVMGFANGGIAPGGGRMSVVGERGPELIQPAAASRVIPNHALGSGGGASVNVGSINVSLTERDDETSEEQAARIGKTIREEMRGLVIQELGNQSRKGNILNPAPIKAFR